MAYMTIRARQIVSPCRDDNIMHEDEQKDGEHIDNVMQFIAKLHDRHRKGKHTRIKKKKTTEAKEYGVELTRFSNS